MGGCGVVGVQGEAEPGVGSEEEEGDDSRQAVGPETKRCSLTFAGQYKILISNPATCVPFSH